MVAGIYEIKNATNDCVYIGQSFDVDKRIHNHIAHLENNTHKNNALQKDYNAGHIFICSILEIVPNNIKGVLKEREQHYINKYQENGLVYNIQQAGVLSNKSKHDQLVKDGLIESKVQNKIPVDIISNRDFSKELKIQLLKTECEFWRNKYFSLRRGVIDD